MHPFPIGQPGADQQPYLMSDAQLRPSHPVANKPSHPGPHGRSTASPSLASMLTPRELEVVKLVAQGLTNGGIARNLVLSEHTVRRHLANIFRKLNISSRAAAAAWGAGNRLF
jgi:DNA-binding NarL/FixJ family response regulator